MCDAKLPENWLSQSLELEDTKKAPAITTINAGYDVGSYTVAPAVIEERTMFLAVREGVIYQLLIDKISRRPLYWMRVPDLVEAEKIVGCSKVKV